MIIREQIAKNLFLHIIDEKPLKWKSAAASEVPPEEEGEKEKVCWNNDYFLIQKRIQEVQHLCIAWESTGSLAHGLCFQASDSVNWGTNDQNLENWSMTWKRMALYKHWMNKTQWNVAPIAIRNLIGPRFLYTSILKNCYNNH